MLLLLLLSSFVKHSCIFFFLYFSAENVSEPYDSETTKKGSQTPKWGRICLSMCSMWTGAGVCLFVFIN